MQLKPRAIQVTASHGVCLMGKQGRRHSCTGAQLRRKSSGHIDDGLLSMLRRKSTELVRAPEQGPTESLTDPTALSSQDTSADISNTDDSRIIPRPDNRDDVEEPGEEVYNVNDSEPDEDKRSEVGSLCSGLDEDDGFSRQTTTAVGDEFSRQASSNVDVEGKEDQTEDQEDQVDPAPAIAHTNFILQRLEELSSELEALNSLSLPETAQGIQSKIDDIKKLVELARLRLASLEDLSQTFSSHSSSMNQLLETWTKQLPQVHSVLTEALQSAPVDPPRQTYMKEVEHCLITLGILDTTINTPISKYGQTEDDDDFSSTRIGSRRPSQQDSATVDEHRKKGRAPGLDWDAAMLGMETRSADFDNDPEEDATQMSQGKSQAGHECEKMMAHQQEPVSNSMGQEKDERVESSHMKLNQESTAHDTEGKAYCSDSVKSPAATGIRLQEELELDNSADLGAPWYISPQSSPGARSVMESLQRLSSSMKFPTTPPTKEFTGASKTSLTGRIKVGGLPEGCTEEAMRDHFGQYGRVMGVELKQEPTEMGGETAYSCLTGYVTFRLKESARQVLENYETNTFQGQWIDCRASSPEKADASGRHDDGRASGVYDSGKRLSDRISEGLTIRASSTADRETPSENGSMTLKPLMHSATGSSAIDKPSGLRPTDSLSKKSRKSRRRYPTNELTPLQLKLRSAILESDCSTLDLMTLIEGHTDVPEMHSRSQSSEERSPSLPKIFDLGSQQELARASKQKVESQKPSAPPWSLPGLVGRRGRWISHARWSTN